MQTNVTLTPAQTFVMNSIVQVDSTGTPLSTPDPSYSSVSCVSSNTAVAGVQGNIRVAPTGILGTATITATETSSDPSKPVITGTLVVTVVGPSAAALVINGVVQ